MFEAPGQSPVEKVPEQPSAVLRQVPPRDWHTLLGMQHLMSAAPGHSPLVKEPPEQPDEVLLHDPARFGHVLASMPSMVEARLSSAATGLSASTAATIWRASLTSGNTGAEESTESAEGAPVS